MLLLSGWARDGLTDEQIANNVGVAPSTLYTWKEKYPKISEALKRSKEMIDMEVENALQKSATGYYVTIKKPIKVKRVLVEDGVRKEFEDIKMIEEQQYIPPNTTAQIFWLKNRQPKKWRDKVDVEQKAEETIRIVDDI